MHQRFLWLRLASLLLILGAFLSSGCFSYRVHEPMLTEGEPVVGTPCARVVNPELDEELLILRQSKLYNLTDEPAPLSIKLEPLRVEQSGCGSGLLLTAITLGFGPGATNETFRYSFVECETGARRTVQGTLTRLHGVQEVVHFSGRAGPIGEAVGNVIRAAEVEVPTTKSME